MGTEQIQEFSFHSEPHLMPNILDKMRQHALILYNQHGRPGADDEANNLSTALEHAGCDVIKQTWSCVRELQTMMVDRLQSIGGSCSFLMVCFMSHGSIGTLQGNDGEEIAINMIVKILSENLPSHLPLVRFWKYILIVVVSESM